MPGIGASPDKMLQARLLAYQDAHRYRISANPNQGGGANFYSNDRADQGAPVPSPEFAAPPMPVLEQAWIGPHDQDGEDYHRQAEALARHGAGGR